VASVPETLGTDLTTAAGEGRRQNRGRNACSLTNHLWAGLIEEGILNNASFRNYLKTDSKPLQERGLNT
jgi:hypothetical protein